MVGLAVVGFLFGVVVLGGVRLLADPRAFGRPDVPTAPPRSSSVFSPHAAGRPMLGWGQIDEGIYLHPVGLVDMRIDQLRWAGLARLPTLIGHHYTGRAYIG